MQIYKIKDTEEYREWYAAETPKSKRQISKRLKMIEEDGHFGYINDALGNGLAELKFNDGRRIYYVVIPITPTALVLLLIGGNKNGQEKDIKKAKSILGKIGQN